MRIISAKKIFILFFLMVNFCVFALADCAGISQEDANKIMYSEKKDTNTVLYIPKSQENMSNPQDDLMTPQKVELLEKKEIPQKNQSKVIVQKEQIQNINYELKSDKKEKKEKAINKEKQKEVKNNITTDEVQDRILESSSRKINAIYPVDEAALNNAYPGYRGANQLVIYTEDFGRTTGTNEFGKEAVVIDGIVVKLTGANSTIPRDGYVISGHGSAKKWISENLKIGTKVEINDREITAYLTIDSYRYFAKTKIEEVEKVLISFKNENSGSDDKYVYYYLKKAKQQYKKSLKDNSDSSLTCAKESIENATIAYRYTVPYIPNELKGTWIRPTEKNIEEVRKTLDKIKSAGINNVFLETYYHGRTIFPSQVMRANGFEVQNPEFNYDVLKAWVEEAHKRGIKIHTWFESFYVGNKSPELYPNSILAVQPTWQNRTKQKADFEGYVSHPNEHNGYFLDPANPDVVNFVLSLINEIVTRYDVDGVNIDYVRYPNIAKENYNNQWGYTTFARQEFIQMYEVDPIEIEPKTKLWDDWCEYRRDKITNYVQKASLIIRSRNKTVSAVIFPDYRVSLQTKHQDWTRWVDGKYLDAVTPLILTSDDVLAKSMLEEIKRKTENNALVYPGLFAGFIESDPEDLLRQIHIIRKLRLNGVILFDWAHLSDKYIKVLKTSAFKE